MRAMTAVAIEPGRLARAIHMRVEALSPGLYRVEGGSRPHDVDVRDPALPVCRCEDRCKVPCKHILAVRIVEGDPAVLAAAQALVAARRR